ncbi:hypothetical protein HPP92_021210 [Vanilla planifolia]|uniref:Uncharacterized protein n=1 Tax=Vanilla planifolia TaxID=51239 RepID=A0A835Q462_VANPL|nr:hypothetical protein HPP92_021210 [Vanilla planifolia]
MRKLNRESWLGMMRRGRKRELTDPGKVNIGVLTFEVSTLMSKAVHLWNSLADEQIARLRDEVLHLEGVRKLVSDDDDFLLGLALAEIMDSVDSLSRAVARLGKRSVDPALQRFEHLFEDLIKNDSDSYGFQYAGKKMGRKVKKMERFVAAGANLYQELEVLAELEQGLRRLQANQDTRHTGNSSSVFKQKVVWQRQAVKCLREASLWNRSFEYTARLLARSVFTVVCRIKLVFGFHQKDSSTYSKTLSQFSRSYSVSGVIHSPVFPSDGRGIHRFASGPITVSTSKSGSIARASHPTLPLRSKWSISSRTFRGCIVGDNHSPVLHSCVPIDEANPKPSSLNFPIGEESESDAAEPSLNIFSSNRSLVFFGSRRKLLSAPPSTLGAAALALHYANVIIVIEKLAASPHLIADDARDDLYGMLPTSIRAALRLRLKSYAKNLLASVYDPELASEWGDAIARILEWLSPLAHNMIKWQSDRNFEQQHLVSTNNVLLLQTLHYANQLKTEAAITELLVGLNYLWRFRRELNAKAMVE